jgi:hypothetical protein
MHLVLLTPLLSQRVEVLKFSKVIPRLPNLKTFGLVIRVMIMARITRITNGARMIIMAKVAMNVLLVQFPF